MTYDERVRAYEAEGMTRSDAQGIVDLEDMRAAKRGGTMGTHTRNLLETVKRLVRAFEDPDHIDPFIAFAMIEQAKEAIRLAEGRP